MDNENDVEKKIGNFGSQCYGRQFTTPQKKIEHIEHTAYVCEFHLEYREIYADELHCTDRFNRN